MNINLNLLLLEMSVGLFNLFTIFEAVGKSSILTQFTENKFIDSYEMTVGVEFLAKSIEIENNKINL